MLKINRKVEYALMALKFMCDKPAGERTTAREISARFKIPFDTISKVMQSLNSQNIVSSVQGVKGGYALSKTLECVTYKDLVEIVEGPGSFHECSALKPCDLRETCNISGPMRKLNNKLIKFLEGITLDQLLYEKF